MSGYRKLTEHEENYIWNLYKNHDYSPESISELQHLSLYNINKTIKKFEEKENEESTL